MSRASKSFGNIDSFDEKLKAEALELLNNWDSKKKELDSAKSDESKLREEVVLTFFGESTYDFKGTYKFDLHNNYRISAVFTQRATIDDAALKATMTNLHEQGIDINEVFNWKPELNTAAYNALSDEQKLLLSSIVTFKSGTPQVKIELPKRK